MSGEASDMAYELVLAAGGDERAMRIVWRAHQPGLLRYLRARVGADDAQDIAQQVWIEAARLLLTFTGGPEDFRRLLFSIAHRRTVDEFRRRGRRPESSGDVPEQTSVVDFDAGGSMEGAIALVRRLAPDQAEAVLLRVVADLDVGEVAAIMGKTEGAVRVLVHRGLHRLAELLGRPEPTVEDRPVTLAPPAAMNEVP